MYLRAGEVKRDLAADGIKAGISRIRRIRKKLGIRCQQIRKFKATAPNEIWVSDMTYIATDEG